MCMKILMQFSQRYIFLIYHLSVNYINIPNRNSTPIPVGDFPFIETSYTVLSMLLRISKLGLGESIVYV